MFTEMTNHTTSSMSSSFASHPLLERDYLFDNLKAAMLFLVAVGHILDPYITRQDSLYRYLMQYIYLFHMPMFAFITGYFSKNSEKARATAVKKVLLPYVFWQILYILTALLMMRLRLADYNTDVFRPSLLLPSSPLYYLLCVFVWKLLIKDITALRWPVFFSILAGLLVSVTFDEALHIGWGACFSLLPFFVLGFLCTPKHVAKIRKFPKPAAFLILLAAILPSVVLPYEFRNVRFTYADVGLTASLGILYRILFYGIAFLMILALINLFSAKKTAFSRIGTNAILVYAGSSFASPALYLLLTHLVPLETSVPLNLFSMCLFSLCLVLFCSMDWIKRIYDWIMDGLVRLLFRD